MENEIPNCMWFYASSEVILFVRFSNIWFSCVSAFWDIQVLQDEIENHLQFFNIEKG